jgi:hypothetical protein
MSGMRAAGQVLVIQKVFKTISRTEAPAGVIPPDDLPAMFLQTGWMITTTSSHTARSATYRHPLTQNSTIRTGIGAGRLSCLGLRSPPRCTTKPERLKWRPRL